MKEFQSLEGRLLLSANGVYKQADLFVYGRQIYAKYGQGYIAIKANGSTSKNKVHWRDMELEAPVKNHIGNLVMDLPKTGNKAA